MDTICTAEHISLWARHTHLKRIRNRCIIEVIQTGAVSLLISKIFYEHYLKKISAIFYENQKKSFFAFDGDLN